MPRKPYDKLVTLNKRKRGIIRKAIELCNMCDQQIYIAMYDKERETLVQFKSDDLLKPSRIVDM